MTPNIILSATDASQALAALKALIAEPWTILAVFGNSENCTNALNICSQKINSGHPYYAGVRCVHIPNPALILPWIKGLKMNPDVQIDWDNTDSYLIASISAVYNNIGFVYTAEKYFEFPEAKTDRLVLKAQAVDITLN